MNLLMDAFLPLLEISSKDTWDKSDVWAQWAMVVVSALTAIFAIAAFRTQRKELTRLMNRQHLDDNDRKKRILRDRRASAPDLKPLHETLSFSELTMGDGRTIDPAKDFDVLLPDSRLSGKLPSFPEVERKLRVGLMIRNEGNTRIKLKMDGVRSLGGLKIEMVGTFKYMQPISYMNYGCPFYLLSYSINREDLIAGGAVAIPIDFVRGDGYCDSCTYLHVVGTTELVMTDPPPF